MGKGGVSHPGGEEKTDEKVGCTDEALSPRALGREDSPKGVRGPERGISGLPSIQFRSWRGARGERTCREERVGETGQISNGVSTMRDIVKPH